MHNDNEKPFRNHIEDMPRKSFYRNFIFTWFWFTCVLWEKFKKYGNNKFHFIPNCLIVLQLKDDQIKHICYIKSYWETNSKIKYYVLIHLFNKYNSLNANKKLIKWHFPYLSNGFKKWILMVSSRWKYLRPVKGMFT